MSETRKSPFLGHDSWLYDCSLEEIDFVIASRYEMISNDGSSFDADYVARKGWSVGLVPFDRDDELEVKLRHLFGVLGGTEETALFGWAAFDKELAKPKWPIDRKAFCPPLIGKVTVDMDGFIDVRKSMIGIYSDAYGLFPRSLSFALLDVNGHFTLVAAKRQIVEDAIASSVEASWGPALEERYFQSEYQEILRHAALAYGYGSAAK